MESMGFFSCFWETFLGFWKTGKNCQHSGNLLKTSFLKKWHWQRMTAKFVELCQLGEFSLFIFEKNVRYKKYFTLSCRLDYFILYCIHWIRPRLTRKVTRGHNKLLTGRRFRSRLLIPVLKTSLKNMRYRDHELRIRSDTLIYFIILMLGVPLTLRGYP